MSSWIGLPMVNSYNGLNLNTLTLNSAYVICKTSFENVGVYSVNDDCYECPFNLVKTIRRGENASWTVDTSVQQTWRIMNSALHDTIERKVRGGLICEIRPTIEEFGVYRLTVGSCEVLPEVPPIDSHLPVVLCAIIMFTFGMLYYLARNFFRRYKKGKQPEGLSMNDKKEDNRRILSLKVMRGIILSAIIFLTIGGGGYPFAFRSWGSVNLADFLFYCFIWTLGMKIPNTIDKALSKGQKKCSLFTDIIKRSMTLFMAGVVIDSSNYVLTGPEIASLWSPLERLGISYLIASTTYLITAQNSDLSSKNIVVKVVANVISLLWCWIFTGFLFAVAIILMSTMTSFNCQGNIVSVNEPSFVDVTNACMNDMTYAVNKFLVGDTHIVSLFSYYGFTKGILSILSAAIVCMIGMKAGVVYVQYESHSDRLKLWTFWSVFFGVGAFALAGVSAPLKFNLWPLAILLFISSTSFLVLSIIYTVLEFSKTTNGGIFKPIGVTSLVILSAHLLFSRSYPFDFDMEFSNHFLYLAQNIWTVSLWMIIAAVLMRKGVTFSL